MGEKIRDIRPIKIGNTSLMIELNEGYTASQGRVIHIQNSKFRYLLTEKDFYHFSSMVMRSWSEYEYIKKCWADNLPKKTFKERESIGSETKEKLTKLSAALIEHSIDYRILDIQNKLITLVIKDSCLKEAQKVLVECKYLKTNHPYGKERGYIFLYQMHRFLLYKLDNIYVEIFCQLPCASLTPKTWIPLDRAIQSRLWENRLIDKDVIWCDLICQFIYHLCWSVFVNQGFTPFVKSFVSKHKQILEEEILYNLLSLVFFKFTPLLIQMTKEERYDEILRAYYQFDQY